MLTKINTSVVGLLILFSTPAYSADSVVRICGGIAAIENVFMKIKEPFEKSTQIKLEVKDTGSDEAMLMLEAGQCDVGTTGISFDEILNLLKQKKQSFKDEKKFIPNTVGRDRRLVLANSSIGVKSLSNEQLKKIAIGEIKNWKDVGGADLPVITVFITKSPGLFAYWKKNIMGGADWAKQNSKEVENVQDAKKLIGETTGAWTIVPASTKVEGDKLFLPEIPVHATPIYAYSYGKPSDHVQKLFDFLTIEGGKYIHKINWK